MSESDRLRRTLARVDEINTNDPRKEEVDGELQPKELVYGRRMSEMLDRFRPDASEALRIAARAQHVARWEIPRSDFPEGRSGYKRWRVLLMQHHADVMEEVLQEEGYDDESVEKVRRLLRKQGMKRDPEVQALEDVVCLVFLRYYFDDFAADHEEEKLVDILRKTWRKMSDQGREAALELDLSPETGRLVERALAG